MTIGPDLSRIEIGADPHAGHAGQRIGCGSCGTRSPEERFITKRPDRAAWVAIEKALASHGGVALDDPYDETFEDEVSI